MKTCKRGREGAVRPRGSPSAAEPPLPATAPRPHRKPMSRSGGARTHTHTAQKRQEAKTAERAVPSAPGRRRKHGRERKVLVLPVKANPKAPLPAWAACPHPPPGAALAGPGAPGAPAPAPRRSTTPCVLLRHRGLAQAQSSPHTVLGEVGGIFRQTGSRFSPECVVMAVTAATVSTHWESCTHCLSVCPHVSRVGHDAQVWDHPRFTDEDTEGQEGFCPRITAGI